MSTRFDDTWTLGETWTLIVPCTASDGSPVTPVNADWKLKGLDDSTIAMLTEASGITIAGNVCTITIPTSEQDGIASRTYWHRLKITDASGAISRQIHGLIRVLRGD